MKDDSRKHRDPVDSECVEKDEYSLKACRPTEMLNELVIERFRRLVGAEVVAGPLDAVNAKRDGRAPSALLEHALCRHCSTPEYCEDSWHLHTGELYGKRSARWYKCDFGRWCAVILVERKRCRADVCKLVCDGQMKEEEFKRQVELLEILVENLVARHNEFLSEICPNGSRDDSHEAPKPILVKRPLTRVHPQVRNAIKYIEEHATDPSMSVSRIARDLGINSTYLAHLFSDQVGMWMSRYIAAHRIELAKELLATQKWQIKRIAHETGHGNADWFSEVFREHTGVTPSEYRRNVAMRG